MKLGNCNPIQGQRFYLIKSGFAVPPSVPLSLGVQLQNARKSWLSWHLWFDCSHCCRDKEVYFSAHCFWGYRSIRAQFWPCWVPSIVLKFSRAMILRFAPCCNVIWVQPVILNKWWRKFTCQVHKRGIHNLISDAFYFPVNLNSDSSIRLYSIKN